MFIFTLNQQQTLQETISQFLLGFVPKSGPFKRSAIAPVLLYWHKAGVNYETIETLFENLTSNRPVSPQNSSLIGSNQGNRRFSLRSALVSGEQENHRTRIDPPTTVTKFKAPTFSKTFHMSPHRCIQMVMSKQWALHFSLLSTYVDLVCSVVLSCSVLALDA